MGTSKTANKALGQHQLSVQSRKDKVPKEFLDHKNRLKIGAFQF